MNLTIEWAFGILVSFVIALLWHFIRVLDKKFDEANLERKQLHNELNSVKLGYATKLETRELRKEIIDLLNEIKSDIKQVNDKLDKKADKS